jgi:hypothetical protein
MVVMALAVITLDFSGGSAGRDTRQGFFIVCQANICREAYFLSNFAG